MTRILHVIASSDLRAGGPIEGARRFAEVWARDGHRQDLLTLDAPGEYPLQDYPGEIFALGPGRGLYEYSSTLLPWLQSHAGKYDAVIVSGLWRYMVRAAYRALSGGSVPYFVYTHGMLDPWFRKAMPRKHWVKQATWLFAEGPLIRDAAKVLFTTEEERRLAEGAFWPYKVNAAVVGYGTRDVEGDAEAQVAAFRQAMPKLGNRRFLLFLSRIHEKKGCDLLVEAFARFASCNSDLDLVIAGPDQSGLVSGLSARSEELGIVNRIHFPGMINGDVKFGAFRAAEAFVLPSHQENFGVVVAEAMACCTPVLISDKVNIWQEVVADGGGLVEPDTVIGATNLLTRFAALSPDERTAMGQAARNGFVRRFRVEEAAGTLMSLIESEIAKRRIDRQL